MNGTKAPIGSWKKYQSERANGLQLATWYKDGVNTGIGIVTGAASGNLEMLELEGRAVAAGALDTVREIAEASGLDAIWHVLNQGYVELTPSGGLHWLYRIADEPVPGNTKLARRPGENGGVEVLCETRGEGGYVVVAPSHGAVHPSGRGWVMVQGSPAQIPTLSWEERQAIHQVFRCLDEMPTVETVKEAVTAAKQDGLSPGDDYNARATWDEILTSRGWSKVFTAGQTTYWRRPGKSVGISATTGRNDGDNLYVFSTSTEFDAEKPYSKFAAKAHLEFNGDFKACARELRRAGYGSIQPVSENLTTIAPKPDNTTGNLTTVEADILDRERPGNADEHSDPVGDDLIQERSSWWPKPLDLDGSAEEPAPAFLVRDDGSRLIYKGKVNGLLGESESGKTWVALFAVQQALAEGRKVIYIDFEDSARSILGRLRALGAMDFHLQHLVYANPDEGLNPTAAADLYEALASFNPELVVVDGFNEAMTLLGLDINSNNDVTKFGQVVLRPLKKLGAAVLTIDHVPKSKENRGNYAIGAQAKRALIDGTAIAVEVLAPFGRGQNGELRLSVTKDRPGHVRAISLGAKAAGVAHLRSAGPDKVRIAIVPVGGAGGSFRPTHLMEKISKLLEASTASLTKATVEKSIEGKAEAVRQGCQVLMDEGYIKVENGARNSLNLSSLRPYREADDPASDAYKLAQAFDSDDESGW